MSAPQDYNQNDFDEYADEGRFGKWFIIATVIISALALLFFLPSKCSSSKGNEVAETLAAKREKAKQAAIAEAKKGQNEGGATPSQTDQENAIETDSRAVSKVVAQTKNPQELVEFLKDALAKGDLERVSSLISPDILTPEVKAQLKASINNGQLTPSAVMPVREIGQLELNRLTRWAIPLKATGEFKPAPLIVETKKNERSRWEISSVQLPQSGESLDSSAMDSLDMADAFLNAVNTQDFSTASQFVDSSKVSDVKIAGLCILFEEGQYRLASKSPLRAMIRKDHLAAYLANVEGQNPGESAKFGINFNREAGKGWKISEINLDSLLANFTNQQGGGDVQYSPLVKNPSGGETLVIYFDFDSTDLTPRLQRQLDIVSMILKGDASKKINISGHADALGSDDYNTQLSAQRAQTVRSYLGSVGVPENQVITLAEGEARPLRPNTTETGEDDPTGRRANRRTEIYLDF